MRVLVVAETGQVGDRHVHLAELDPLFDQRRVVLAGVEAAGDGRRRERGLAAAHGPAAGLRQAINHAAVVRGGVFQVLDRLVDRALGHGYAGVLGGAERLHLRHRDRALVGVMAVGGRGVIPTAPGGLSLADKTDRPCQHILELAAAVVVFLLAVALGQEERAEAVAIHVATGLGGDVGIGQQTVALATIHEPVGCPAYVIGVFALAERAP